MAAPGYAATIRSLLRDLGPGSLTDALEIARLPEVVRGFEEVKTTPSGDYAGGRPL